MVQMRLFKRSGIYYIGIKRGLSRSLKTRDESIAKETLKELQKEHIKKHLLNIEKAELKLLNEFRQEYLTSRQVMKKNTLKADRLALDKFVEFYGNRPMKGITNRKLEEFRGFLKALKLKDTSCNCYIRHLRGAIKTAIKWGYITKSPLDDFKLFRVDKRQPRYMNFEDVNRALMVAGDYCREMQTALAMQYFTGMGRAEIISQFSLSEGNITYRRVKTGKLISVPIAEGLRPYITHLRKGIVRLLPWKNPRTYNKHFAEIMKLAGIEGISPHKIRHTFATHLLDAGIDIKTISELMGHSSIHITSEFYAHLTEEKKKKAVNELRLGK